MGVRERIQYELARIAEQEEATRARIARENKKRELVRQIREEMAKIRGLDVDGSPHTEVEDIPGWVKMVQSAESKRAAASGLDKPSQLKQEMQQNRENVACLCDADTQREKQEKDTTVSEVTATDAKPGMTFEESVSALLSLIEEEKSPKPKATLMSKKPKDVKVNCSLKAVSEAKHKFEELSHSGASPTSPASQQQQHILDHEINRLNVQRARESLLKTQQQQSSEAKAEGGGKAGVFRKKCSDIKEMLTKKTKKNYREPPLEGARKHKKKVMLL